MCLHLSDKLRQTFLLSTLLFLVSCQNQGINGEDLFEKGKFAEAVAFYTSHLESSGYDPEIVYNRGRAYEEMNSMKLARADYNLVLKNDERHLHSRLSLSKLAYEAGNYSKSLILVGKALTFHENSSQAHFLSARASHQLGLANTAMESYNVSISLNRAFGEAYLYRGALKTTLKIKSACEDFKVAQKMNVEGAKEAVEKFCF